MDKLQLEKQLQNLCTSYANMVWNNSQKLDFNVEKAIKLEEAIWAWIEKNFVPLELPVMQNLPEVATRLYLAGKWECKSISNEDQIKLWENLRNALGLPIGTAKKYGVSA